MIYILVFMVGVACGYFGGPLFDKWFVGAWRDKK